MDDESVRGFTAPELAPVRAAFAELVADGAETGAALSVYRQGEQVVELVVGSAADGRPWQTDTLVNAFSAGKPVIAVALLVLVDRGLVDLDAPVARYWPEFGASGKGGTTVRQALSHAAGVPVFSTAVADVDVTDWTALTADLAAAAPTAAIAEHALTYGHLVGEIIRRVTGRPPGGVVHTEVAVPWGLDLFFGVPADALDRVATLEYASPDWPEVTAGEPGSVRWQALNRPADVLDLATLNSRRWRRTAFPAVNLHTTADALARFYAGLAAGGELDGVRLLAPDLVAQIAAPQAVGHDGFNNGPAVWGLGVSVEAETSSWGMSGIGGCIAYAHTPGGGVGAYQLGYVTRRLHDHERGEALIAALESCL